jgi:hypothetical protein
MVGNFTIDGLRSGKKRYDYKLRDATETAAARSNKLGFGRVQGSYNATTRRLWWTHQMLNQGWMEVGLSSVVGWKKVFPSSFVVFFPDV